MAFSRPVLVIVPLCTLLVAGCVPTGEPVPTSTPSSSPSVIASPTPEASTPAPEPGVAIGIDCEQLVPAQVMYDFNSNFALEAEFTPTEGTPGADAVAELGIACSWVNLTSGQTIEIAAAQPAPSRLEARRIEVAGFSNTVPTYEVEGFFVVEDGLGRADAFDGPYWISMTSEVFFEPGEVAPLMAAAVAALN